MRDVARLSLAAALPAALGGVVFWAAHGETTIGRSIAYGLWLAAAACVLSIGVAGSRQVWRRTSLRPFEGWVFGAAAVVLTVAGAAVDVATAA